MNSQTDKKIGGIRGWLSIFIYTFYSYLYPNVRWSSIFNFIHLEWWEPCFWKQKLHRILNWIACNKIEHVIKYGLKRNYQNILMLCVNSANLSTACLDEWLNHISNRKEMDAHLLYDICAENRMVRSCIGSWKCSFQSVKSQRKNERCK